MTSHGGQRGRDRRSFEVWILDKTWQRWGVFAPPYRDAVDSAKELCRERGYGGFRFYSDSKVVAEARMTTRFVWTVGHRDTSD